MKKQNQHPEQVITTHINADFDALASMIAANKLYPEAALVFPGAQEKNLRNFFLHSASYLFNFLKLKHVELDCVKRLILVDTRQRSRIGKFAELVDKDGVEIHIYDHHPASDDDIQGNVEVIRQVGANTTILTQLIRERGIKLSSDEATLMCLGIHEDTGSFTFSSTTPQDYYAAAWLSEQGANPNIIADMLTRELTAEQVWLLNDLTKAATRKIINGVEIVITKVVRDEYIGDFAVLVHKLMEMENFDVVFALAQMEDRIYLVARSRVPEVNVGQIATALGGGGHPQAASATIKNKTLAQVERSLNALLRNRIGRTSKARDMMSSPVISVPPNATVKRAADLMTRFNINVLLVIDQGNLKGYITRQVVEKAVFFGLEDLKVSDYMNIEFCTVRPEASLKEVQDLIIKNKLRVLPVVDEGQVQGVITRTDLLNILVGEPVVPDLLGEKGEEPQGKRKNMANIMKERLPRKIIQLLKDLGHVGDILGYNVYLVGGLVRDVLLHRDNLDVDIVVEGDGIEFAHEYAKHYEARVRSHKKFGTAVLIFPDNFKVDVATARMEYYESPGSPPVVQTSSLKMDLYRRDFTINTLAIKLNKRDFGTLIDYFGGQRDIKEKVIRVLHNLSFVEDPTRVFRAIRFEQRFGFKIGKLTLSLIKNAVKIDALKEISGHRLFMELRLILSEPDPIKAIERMNEFNLLQYISPNIVYTDNLKGLLEEVKGVIGWYRLLYLEEPFEPWKVYWYALTSSLETNEFAWVMEFMGMVDTKSAAMVSQRKKLMSLARSLHGFSGDNYELYTLLSAYDTEILLFLMAKTTSERTRRLISLYFTKLKQTKVELRGKELIDLGMSPGPVFKRVFEEILKGRLNQQLQTKEDELEMVRQRFGHLLENSDHT